MDTMNAYRVTLPTTNAARNTARDGVHYLNVEEGEIYVLAINAAAVGARFPAALGIARIGLGACLECSGRKYITGEDMDRMRESVLAHDFGDDKEPGNG